MHGFPACTGFFRENGNFPARTGARLPPVPGNGRALVLVLVLVLGTGLAAQESGEWYLGRTIRNVQFRGLRHIATEDLAFITESCIGKPFSDDLFWELQGRLYSLEYFDQISPSIVQTGDGIVIYFDVTERPVISRIVFSGNRGIPRRDLLDTITLRVNDVANQIKLQADSQAILAKYLEKGYPDAQVRSAVQPSREGDTVVLTFYIEEGDRITVAGYRFEGNETFSDGTLRGRLSLKSKGIFESGAFQEAKLAADRETLLGYYRDRGYIDAEILDVVRDIQSDAKGANRMIITYRLYEGRSYIYGGTTFEGNRIFTAAELEKLVWSRPGRTVNARQIEADYQRVSGLYYQSGYIFNTIARSERRDADTGTVYYHISIVERGRAHIENIILRGNEKTRDHVILREIPLEPGDIFSQAKIYDAYRNLYNLQFFSAVSVETPPGSADGLMNLVFDFEEQPTTNVQFGMTFSGTSDPNEFPIAVILSIQDRNFLGYGNSLGASANLSRDTQSLSINYTHRWLFGLPLDGSFDLTGSHSSRLDLTDTALPYAPGNGNGDRDYPDGFSNYEDFSRLGYPSSEYLMSIEQWALSLGFGTGYRWLTPLGNLLLRGGIRAGFEHNAYDDTLYRPFDPVLRDHNNEIVPAFSLWSSISLDKRDIYYDPSKGYYLSERMGYYGFLKSEREFYTRSDTKGELYFTLFNLPVSESWSFKAVLGFHTGLSFILPHPMASDVPIVEKANLLLVDGMFIGRGWDEARYPTRGRALWENWVELRFPLVPGMLALDFFFDAVSWARTPEEFFTRSTGALADSMYFSLGFGPRIAIPQFPFRFLFASRFRIQDGRVQWYDGNMGPLKFVLSLSIPVY